MTGDHDIVEMDRMPAWRQPLHIHANDDAVRSLGKVRRPDVGGALRLERPGCERRMVVGKGWPGDKRAEKAAPGGQRREAGKWRHEGSPLKICRIPERN